MTVEERVKQEFDFCNITKYHEMGFTGKGITVLNHEANSGHSTMTTSIIKSIAPDVTMINAEVSTVTRNGKLTKYVFKINGKEYSVGEMYKTFKPDIMSVSFIGPSSSGPAKAEALKPYIERGLNIVCATGNRGSGGILGYYKEVAINIGSAYINQASKKIQLNGYSSYGDIGDVTFASFNGDGTGTSAATPFFAGMLALFMQRFGKFKQDKNIELIKKCCVDINDDGQDAQYGYGLFVLPESDDIIKEENAMPKFVDMPEDRWSTELIELCAEAGILNGYPNGTFKPEENITREEVGVALGRVIQYVNERIK